MSNGVVRRECSGSYLIPTARSLVQVAITNGLRLAKSPESSRLNERIVQRAYIDWKRLLVMQLSEGVAVTTESPSPLQPVPGVSNRQPSFQ